MRERRRRALAVAVAAAAVAVAIPGAVTAGPKPGPARVACEWPMYGHDVGRSFAQEPTCTFLTRFTAPLLTPAWVYLTSDNVSASPTVVDDTVYVGDWSGRFHALPAHPSTPFPEPLWTFDVTDTNDIGFGRIVSSAAAVKLRGTRVILFGGGATLYALDGRTGRLLTSICLDPRADPAIRCNANGAGPDVEVESSPAVVPLGDDRAAVVVGVDVHNADNVGRTGVVRLDLHADGQWWFEPRWKFDPEARHPYNGPGMLTEGAGTGNGCGGVWSSPALDVDAGSVFFGTASCSVDGIDTGERLWSVGLESGALRWEYGPPRTGTRLDDDFGASPNLLPGGLIGNGGKDGWYYALSRDPGPNGQGALAWATHAGQSGHATVDFAVGGLLGSPATGLVNGEPAVFATVAISTPIGEPIDGGAASLDASLLEDPTRLFSLVAMRASDGAILWRSPIARPSYGAPTYANGVVLVPSTFMFSLTAFDADTGLPLANWPLAGAPSSSPAVVGDRVFIGAGTRTTDLEYKALGGGAGDALEAVLGVSPLSPLSGVWAFQIPTP